MELDWLETFLAVAGPRGVHGRVRAGPPLPVPGQRAHRRPRARPGRAPDRPHPPPRPAHRGGRGLRPARPGDPRRASAPRAPRSARSAGMDAEPHHRAHHAVHRRRVLPRRSWPSWRRPIRACGCRSSSAAGFDLERRLLGNGPALAVLPRARAPLPPGLRERVLWREPLQVVVPAGDELDRAGGRCRWTRSRADRDRRRHARPSIVRSDDGHAPEVPDQLTARGRVVQPRAVVDTPQTMIALVRAGVGVGVVNAVALGPLDLSGPRRARHRRTRRCAGTSPGTGTTRSRSERRGHGAAARHRRRVRCRPARHPPGGVGSGDLVPAEGRVGQCRPCRRWHPSSVARPSWPCCAPRSPTPRPAVRGSCRSRAGRDGQDRADRAVPRRPRQRPAADGAAGGRRRGGDAAGLRGRRPAGAGGPGSTPAAVTGAAGPLDNPVTVGTRLLRAARPRTTRPRGRGRRRRRALGRPAVPLGAAVRAAAAGRRPGAGPDRRAGRGHRAAGGPAPGRRRADRAPPSRCPGSPSPSCATSRPSSASPLSPVAARRLRDGTRGNPLHARALLAEFPARSWGTGERPLPSPRSFRLVVQGPLVRLLRGRARPRRRRRRARHAQPAPAGGVAGGAGGAAGAAGRGHGCGPPRGARPGHPGHGGLPAPARPVGGARLARRGPAQRAAHRRGGAGRRARGGAAAPGRGGDGSRRRARRRPGGVRAAARRSARRGPRPRRASSKPPGRARTRPTGSGACSRPSPGCSRTATRRARRRTAARSPTSRRAPSATACSARSPWPPDAPPRRRPSCAGRGRPAARTPIPSWRPRSPCRTRCTATAASTARAPSRGAGGRWSAPARTPSPTGRPATYLAHGLGYAGRTAESFAARRRRGRPGLRSGWSPARPAACCGWSRTTSTARGPISPPRRSPPPSWGC